MQQRSHSHPEETFSVHQIWFAFDTNRIPSETHQTCMNAWKNMYASYKLWSLPDAISFVQTNFPMFLTFFEDGTLTYPIVKCDLFRILLLYHFGGIYADIDVYPLRRIAFSNDNANANANVVLTDEWYKSSELTKTIHNAIMIARTPRNPFWLSMALEILRKYKSGQAPTNEEEVYRFSGPKFIHSMVRKLQMIHELGIVVIPFCYFCPFDILPKNNPTSPYPMNSEDSTLIEGSWVYPSTNLTNLQEMLSRYPHSFTIFVFQNSLWKR